MRPIDRLSVLILCLCTLCAPVAATEPIVLAAEVGMSAERLERAAALLQRAVDEGVAGSAVGMISRDGQVVFHRAFGEMEPGVPMTPGAITRMASIGKTITAVAVMRLHEEGKLRLADPVKRFLPEYGGVRVKEANADGAERLVPPARAITVHDLLTHQAGLQSEYVEGGEAVERLWEEAETVGEFARRLAAVPLTFHPGTDFVYGPAYETLAAVAEEASGTPFDTLLRETVLDPLGMDDTSFRVPAEKLDRYAGVYRMGAEGALEMFRRRGEEERPTRFRPGGGGLRGTVGDFHRFARFLLDEGTLDDTQLLAPLTVRLMALDHTEGRFGSSSGDWGWGLGMAVRTRVLRDGAGSVGSYGWNGGTGTLYLVDPAERLIVVVFVPSQPRTPGVWELRDDFVAAAYQAIVEPRVRR
jgi:CubicO group peptidase (beta-lactamase class C family)